MAIDATDRALEAQIRRAQEALVEVAREDAEKWWSPYELKTRARNGWSSGVMGLAIRALIDSGVMEQRPADFHVRLRTA